MSEEIVFVEQAEYLTEDIFLRLTSEHPNESVIINKLTQSGAKLLVGPRGCGKTTLMLKAYYAMCKGSVAGVSADILPLYVNYKNTLKLEPFYKQYPNAMFWFSQWLLFKIYKGIYQYFLDSGTRQIPKLSIEESVVDRIVDELEIGNLELIKDGEYKISVSDLESDVRILLNELRKVRCVLLLDDAAHAFSAEQQKDFFDLFRGLKSKLISPKAAIYPGVTNYSSTFHVGHDAEEIDVWISPESDEYLAFMDRLLKKRLPAEIVATLSKNQLFLEIMYYAAFGMPRALLNMVRELIPDDSDGAHGVRFGVTAKGVYKAISKCFNSSQNVYRSIKYKMPMYSEFVEVGNEIYDKMISLVRDYNKSKSLDRQSVSIAIKQPVPSELLKIIGFLQYSGLLMPVKEVSRGEKGRFELYSIHFAALIDNNAIAISKSKSVPNFLTAFNSRNAHDFTRTTPSVLVDNKNISDIFHLSLPPCQTCKTPRLSESQKFCHNCGAKLKSASLFETLVGSDISQLELTSTRVNKIKEHSRIRIVKDILMDSDNRELRKVPYIGTVWAERIKRYAEEFIA